MCQLPLLFLLSGRQNIVGLLTGFGYERLNWLHRWAARCLLLTATLHMGYWFADWAPYDYITVKVTTDSITRHGLIAWAVLVWIVVSSMTPIRGWNYEFFVAQHLVSFVAFMAMVYLHTPAEVHVWIWIPVGLFFFDRLIRLLSVLHNSLAILHPRLRAGSIWACKATFTPLSHDTTRITVLDPPLKWRAGQHVFITCPSIAPLQSHPFTVASLPRDGKMEFIVQSKKGGTRRFFNYATRHSTALPLSSVNASIASSKSVAIEGPYGRMRPLSQFASVVFLAGSTGATFTLPLMREIISSWTESRQSLRPPTRRVRFVWVVKSQGQLNWFSEQLSAVALDLERWKESGFESWAGEAQVEMSVYLTCDLGFTAGESTSSTPITASGLVRSNPYHRVTAESVSTLPSNEKVLESEKQGASSVHSVPSTLTDRSHLRGTCGPGGSCCCTNTVDDEHAISGIACTCDCAPSQSLHSSPKMTQNLPDDLPNSARGALHSSITLLTGRPNLLGIIRNSLEEALGEAAVVACGPQGLVDDVRRVVVGLSNERAVHKGTGAQGIYLHTEAFGY